MQHTQNAAPAPAHQTPAASGSVPPREA